MIEESVNRKVGGDIVVYETADGGVRVEVIVGAETVWLTEAQTADLFDRDRSVVGRHIRSVFAEGELARESSVQILPRTPDGGRPGATYNLDVIISVGYRPGPGEPGALLVETGLV